MTSTIRAMAFDFGTKRIGIAFGQSLTQTSEPIPEITARDGIPDWQEIEKLLNEWQPDVLVTGLPLNMDGTSNAMCQRARKFARRLHGRFGLPSHVWDERLSSEAAKEEQPAHNYKQSAVDSLAACYILTSWFYNDMPNDPA
ncbi:Putative pre-16S rRNA nuclease [BD1-7 clade bacterium]|uniref:Putative pre-16S rRNA nuclease n=1 Tax=BD1-7 clade bacterium TaxID=2029982 RepID=A0A5S9QD49_9GAMM|nr:Putative pre-16S rRNA nuclease [BD1-7 clade bacterium]